MKRKKIVLLLSGGMDSVVLLYHLIAAGYDVYCVLFNYHQKHVQELEFAKHHCRITGVQFNVVGIPQLLGSSLTDGGGSVVVPFRNATLLGHAINFAAAKGYDSVAYACNKADAAGFPDCRRKFINAMCATSEASEIDVKVVAPFLRRSKRWIYKRGKSLGVDLNQTWSCYRGGEKPCGECPACEKRNEAMRD